MFVVGNTYVYHGEGGYAPYATCQQTEEKVYFERELKIVLRKNSTEVPFNKAVYQIPVDSVFKCISDNPITLEVEAISSNLLTKDNIVQNRQVIAKALKPWNRDLHPLEIAVLYEHCIPWSLKDFVIDEKVVIDTLKEYIYTTTQYYQGTPQGAMHHKQESKQVWTILYGADVANALEKLIDNDEVIEWTDKRGILPYPVYDSADIDNLLKIVKNSVGAFTSKSDQMLKDILKSAEERYNPMANPQDAQYYAQAYLRWYNELSAMLRSMLDSVSPLLGNLSKFNDTASLQAYDDLFFRQSMAVFYGAIPFSGSTVLHDFYDWMYQYVRTEGWVALFNVDRVLFGMVCNKTGAVIGKAGVPTEDRIEKAKESIIPFASNEILYSIG